MRRFAERIGFALNGFKILIMSERHFQIHIVAFGLVVFLAFFFEINSIEWVEILLISGLVLVAESINSSIEKLSDALTKEINPLIKQVKDIAAAAVLLAAVLAIVIGAIIFYPHVSRLFH